MAPNKHPPGALVLAAGQSRRFGGHKLLHPLHDQQPIILQTLNRIRQSTRNIHVIIKKNDAHLGQLLEAENYPFSINDNAHQGMASSIVWGIQNTARWQGWLICLADMPYIKPHTYGNLLQQLKTHSIVQPQYQGKRGNPVGFSAQFKNELLALTGDSGAKKIVANNPAYLCPVDDPGVLQDIDQLSDIPAGGNP